MKRRVLIWFWSGGGGGSAFAVNVARRLALQFGREAVALSLRADDPTLERARTLNLDVRAANIVSDRQRPLQTLTSLARSRRVLAEHAADADLVLIPMNFATAAPLAASLRTPLIYCAHDPLPHPGDYAPLLQRTTQATLLKRATRVVALSDYAARILRGRGVSEDKLVVAPLASVFEPQARAPANDGPVSLLLAGRMIAYKGLDLLADALPLVTARNQWRLSAIGYGPALDSGARAKLVYPNVDRIDHEWLSDEALEARIAACDVLVAPYLSATQSGVVAQALSFGRPCVVTPVGALPEQLRAGEAGWIAPNVTPAALAAVLTEAIDDAPARARKSAAAAKLAQAAWDGDYWGWLERL